MDIDVNLNMNATLDVVIDAELADQPARCSVAATQHRGGCGARGIDLPEAIVAMLTKMT